LNDVTQDMEMGTVY